MFKNSNTCWLRWRQKSDDNVRLPHRASLRRLRYGGTALAQKGRTTSTIHASVLWRVSQTAMFEALTIFFILPLLLLATSFGAHAQIPSVPARQQRGGIRCRDSRSRAVEFASENAVGTTELFLYLHKRHNQEPNSLANLPDFGTAWPGYPKPILIRRCLSVSYSW